MDTNKHIEEMETILDKHNELIEKLNLLLDDFYNNQENLQRLKNYYLSDQYQIDFDKSNDSNLKQMIKCGVLSEDAIYNLLGDNFNIAIKMLELATDIIKRN